MGNDQRSPVRNRRRLLHNTLLWLVCRKNAYRRVNSMTRIDRLRTLTASELATEIMQMISDKDIGWCDYCANVPSRSCGMHDNEGCHAGITKWLEADEG